MSVFDTPADSGGKSLKRCLGCMCEYPSELSSCPECGYVYGSKQEQQGQLAPGNVLKGRYIIGKALGNGGFGITYIAWDSEKKRKVAIKEFIPNGLAARAPDGMTVEILSKENDEYYFNRGVSKFFDEATRLSYFNDDDGVVNIFEAFRENATAYIVMEYLEGMTVLELINRKHTLSVNEAVNIIVPAAQALSRVHAKNILHRDIAPDNIFITTDGKVKLIDFGSARYAAADSQKTLTVMVKPGYSAVEQYSTTGQGTYTDVYSLGATMYRMITGQIPAASLERRAQVEKYGIDPLAPLVEICPEIPQSYSDAVVRAMAINSRDRTATVDEFVTALFTTGNAGQISVPLETGGTGGNNSESVTVNIDGRSFNIPEEPAPKKGSKGIWIFAAVLVVVLAVLLVIAYIKSHGQLPANIDYGVRLWITELTEQWGLIRSVSLK